MRPPLTLLIAVFFISLFFVSVVPKSFAQDDSGDVSLGDLARSLRKKPVPAEDGVIDNDNLSQVMSVAESRRAAGSAQAFSLNPGNSPHVPSPDVTCSLSYNSKSTSLVSDTTLLNELPVPELAKLDGPATIEGDSLQVTLHNGTAWNLREVLIGLTIVRSHESDAAAFAYGHAKIVPAIASASDARQDSFQKPQDVTVLLRVRGSAAPSETATFRTSLNFALFPDQEWHWAIVKAKGISPLTSLDEITKPQQTDTKPGSGSTDTGAKVSLPAPVVSSLPGASSSDLSSSPQVITPH